MSIDYTHIPRQGPEALEFAHAVVHIVDTGASDPIVVSTLKEHAYDRAVALIAATKALNAAEGAERVAREDEDAKEDAADDAVRAGFGFAALRGGTQTRLELRAVCGGRTYGELIRLSGAEQALAIRSFVNQARASADRFGLTESHLDTIESTNEALAVAATATDDAARATSAARLARREAEASFIKGARVSNKILTALISREVLATLLPRFARREAAQG
ncbi:hypothetical protein L6R49_14530 [Myxococcota bacterium]|nr:hypothetical protein [Myxococcota bacterium]